MPARRPPFVAACVLVSLTLVGCSGSAAPKAAPTRTPTHSPSPTPSPTPTIADPPAGGWLTGRAGPTGPVVAIKIDNAPSARPLQHGLQAAQVVYEELVEGGTTRYMAMYVGASDTDIGPVRSARDTDVELLGQYGKVLFGFSGANRGVLAHIDAANLVPVPDERYDGAYTMRGRRVEAYNFYTTPQRLIAAAPARAADLTDVGFRFGPAPAGGVPVSGRLMTAFSTYTKNYLAWDAARGGWHVQVNSWLVQGTDGAAVAPANVLVQFVPLRAGRYVDVLGNNSPDSATIGSGRAVLLRGGTRYDGTWSRSGLTAPTTWTGADGKPLTLAPGQTWVLLVPQTSDLVPG